MNDELRVWLCERGHTFSVQRQNYSLNEVA